MGARIVYVVNTKTGEKREVPVNAMLYAMLVELRQRVMPMSFQTMRGNPA